MSDKDYAPKHTPIEWLKDRQLWLKRDDLFQLAGVRGGKVRSCWRLATASTPKLLVTASSRHSPQMTIVARIAQRLGVPAHCHIPTGDDTPETLEALEVGAQLVRHKPGYNSVIIKRALDDAKEHGGTNIPFGMKCREAVEETALQVDNLPGDYEMRRIVVPVGSAISLAGVLTGIQQYRPDLGKVKVIGIQVGAAIEDTMDKLAPFGWRTMCTVLRAREPYHTAAQYTSVGPVVVDPHYEGKAVGFLEPGDLFWIVGIRRSTDMQKARVSRT